jgi:DUF438 domain-containing protein
MAVEVWVEIASVVLKYGFPAVQEIIKTWSADMTDDEIRAKIKEYQDKLKKPEDYFE